MKVDFKKSFTKDLKKVKEKDLLQLVKGTIQEIEQAPSFQIVSNLKQLKGGGGYFRVRIGDYRIGLKLEGDTVIFVRYLHRKEIYRYFP